MKKIFVAVALVMGLGTTVAFAENLTSGVETVMAVNDFTPIEEHRTFSSFLVCQNNLIGLTAILCRFHRRFLDG